MADKSTQLNPFSVLRGIGSVIGAILKYVARYFSIAYGAIRESWNDGKDMRPEIESSIRSYGVDPAQKWPGPTARAITIVCSLGMFAGRLVLGLFRAL